MNEDDEKLRQAFLSVVELGSYAAGARALARDPSVLSRRISALETKLGIRLLERSTRRVSTTEAGALYYAKLRQAMQLIREAEQEAQTLASAPSGLLRLTLPTAFGRLWITPVLPIFLKMYPTIQIEAVFSDRYADIIAEEFDVAVRIGEMTDSRLFSRMLAPTRRVLCASPTYLREIGPLNEPADLRRVDCLMFTPMATHPVWHFENERNKRAVRVTGKMASDDIGSLIQAARSGCGIVMAADWLVVDDLNDGSLVEVLPEWFATGEKGVYLLRPSKQNESAKVRVFCDWLINHFSNCPWSKNDSVA